MATTLLFDLDGTLLLSEEYKIQAKLDVIRRLGGQASAEDIYALVGQSEEKTADILIKSSGISLDQKTFINEAEALYLPYARQGTPFVKGAQTFLEAAHGRGFTLGLVTSSTKRSVEENASLAKVAHLFSVIVTADDVEKRKPDPEPYLTALKKLSVKPSEAIVFEDSGPGLASSTSAGIPTIFIRHKLNTHIPATEAKSVITSYDLALLDVLK